MSERPTLTISVACPTCGGTTDARFSEKGKAYSREHGTNDCPDCTDGTIRQAVSCQSCKWWESWDYQGQGSCSRDSSPDCGLWCKRGDGLMTLETFGCLSWQAKA